MAIPPVSWAAMVARPARRWPFILLFLGCALVLSLFASSYWQASASLNALRQLHHQAERVTHLDNLLIQLLDAEGAVRGYLLTGNRAHLAPYENGVARINDDLRQIRLDLDPSPENEAALSELSELVAVKLRTLEQAVARSTVGEETRRRGKSYTDRIRDNLLGLKARMASEGQDLFEQSTGHVQQMRTVVATLALTTLTLMLLLFVILRRQFKLREQIAALLESENHRLDAVVQERTAELSDLASHLTTARETEKARLARELHDEMGSLLTAAKMEIGWIGRKLDERSMAIVRERLQHLTELVQNVITLKRRLIDDLRPPLLAEFGLVSTLRALAEDFSRGAEEKVMVVLPEQDVPLPSDRSLALFRIAQEALTNIRKHAQAKQVKLTLWINAEVACLEIEDDGVGFVVAQHRPRRHGLSGMKHRVQMFAGDFDVHSQAGGGTHVVVRIPLASIGENAAAPAQSTLPVAART